MGAAEFSNRYRGPLGLNEAFSATVREAQYENGHGGYTGTIAEKHSVVQFAPPEGVSALEFYRMIRDADPNDCPPALKRVVQAYDDKWGPAVAVKTEDGWLFCGWASS